MNINKLRDHKISRIVFKDRFKDKQKSTASSDCTLVAARIASAAGLLRRCEI